MSQKEALTEAQRGACIDACRRCALKIWAGMPCAVRARPGILFSPDLFLGCSIRDAPA